MSVCLCERERERERTLILIHATSSMSLCRQQKKKATLRSMTSRIPLPSIHSAKLFVTTRTIHLSRLSTSEPNDSFW